MSAFFIQLWKKCAAISYQDLIETFVNMHSRKFSLCDSPYRFEENWLFYTVCFPSYLVSIRSAFVIFIKDVERKISYRRLSTMSSALGHGEKNVTFWKWYLKKSQTEWITYDTTVLLLIFPLISFLICLQFTVCLNEFWKLYWSQQSDITKHSRAT